MMIKILLKLKAPLIHTLLFLLEFLGLAVLIVALIPTLFFAGIVVITTHLELHNEGFELATKVPPNWNMEPVAQVWQTLIAAMKARRGAK